MSLRCVHQVVGVITIAVFIATGVYMRWFMSDAYRDDPAVRFLFRANHIYILFVGLLNLLVGWYLVQPERRWRNRMQAAGSMLLLLTPALLILAFLIEPVKGSPHRMWTAAGVFAAFLGVLLQFPARVVSKR